MTEKKIGYGSTYSKGINKELKPSDEISTVLGRQVWMIQPDEKPPVDNPCIWMQAGVVEFRNCNNFYDCTSCRYDFAMRKGVQKGKYISWQDALRKRDSLARVCRHSLTHRIPARICGYNYECHRCEFDQYFEDVLNLKMENPPYEVQEVKGFKVPKGYYFHDGHAWVRIESGGVLRVGMDDFSTKLLGKSDAFELPLIGKELNRGEAGWGLKRGNNSADALSPINGIIIEVNPEIKERPYLVHDDPYGKGWLFIIHSPNIKKEAEKLMPEKETYGWLHSEISILETMVEEVAGPIAADGGYLTDDIYGNLPQLGWKRLTKTFLKTE